MSEWKAKRFWKAATVEQQQAGFAILLDGRPVKTPGKAPLIVPTQAMGEAIAAEWDAQVDQIDPLVMPVTRGANAAIDKVTPQFAEVVALLAAYGDSDLLCYRAAGPDELVARQAATWDPLLDWAAATYGARLSVAEGVMHVPQPAESLAALNAELTKLTPFQLAAAHDLISLSGSLVLALAVMQKHLSVEGAWAVSRLDEHWQAEQWGHDDDAVAQEAVKSAAFADASRFYDMACVSPPA